MSLSPAQRARRIRQINARLDVIENEQKILIMELKPLEAEETRSRGYTVPMRRKQLIDLMDRDNARMVA